MQLCYALLFGLKHPNIFRCKQNNKIKYRWTIPGNCSKREELVNIENQVRDGMEWNLWLFKKVLNNK